MANAPTPGSFTKDVSKNGDEATPGSRFSLTLCGSTLEMPTAIQFKEKFAVRAATGLPLAAFWGGENKIDEDSLQILWWLMRRYNGEPRLSLDVVMDEWPVNLTEDDVTFEVIEDDGEPTDDPES